MAKNRQTSASVNGEDLANCLRAFREDCGCEARIIVRLAPGDDRDLVVKVEAYTDAGTKLGIAHDLRTWTAGYPFPFLTLVMGLVHSVYHKACERAHVAYKPSFKHSDIG